MVCACLALVWMWTCIRFIGSNLSGLSLPSSSAKAASACRGAMWWANCTRRILVFINGIAGKYYIWESWYYIWACIVVYFNQIPVVAFGQARGDSHSLGATIYQLWGMGRLPFVFTKGLPGLAGAGLTASLPHCQLWSVASWPPRARAIHQLHEERIAQVCV